METTSALVAFVMETAGGFSNQFSCDRAMVFIF